MTADVEGAVTVLHVDDEPDLADLVADFLQREDERFTVETATSASEGLAAMAEGHFDCVVSDFDMPGTSGIEFLRAVRDDDPDLPFILYTGKGSEEVASEAIRAGVTDYLQKESGTSQYTVLANRVLNAVSQYRSAKRAEAIQRIRTILRDVNQLLLRSRNRDEIDVGVCEIISDAEPYRLAWIGEHDAEEQTVVPRASAGAGTEYLDEITITTDESETAEGPTGRAVRSGEISITQSIPDDTGFEPWREAALQHGFGASAAIPLAYDGTTYGVLNVYSDRPGAFDERERGLLVELGEDVAHAMHRVKSEQETERRKERLEEREEVIRNFPNGVIVLFDGDLRYAVVGPETLPFSGRVAAEMEGKTVDELFPEPTADRLESRLRATLDGTPQSFDVDYSGRTHHIETRPANVDGSPHGVLVTQEVTDERRAMEELKRQTERLESFTSIVSHDLRNPLNVARGRLELASEEYSSEHLEAAAAAHDRMAALIEDLLTLARDGSELGEVEPVRLGGLAERCWMSVVTDGASLDLETDRTIRADGSRLRQLLENLIRNAIEHGGTSVTVTVGDVDGGFYVEDDGPGISEENREEIFVPGYSSSADGTGFGLPIVKEIAEAHGWDIHVTEGADGGARFEITGVVCE